MSVDPKSAQQKSTLTFVLLVISLSAIASLFVLRRFPLPIRLLLLTGDLIVIAAIWMIIRQKFSGK